MAQKLKPFYENVQAHYDLSDDFFALLTERFVALGIDGMFTDFPDRTRQLVDSIATE